MKLLTKTTLYFITVSLFIFFFGGIAVYQLIKVLEDNKVNRELIGQMQKFSRDLFPGDIDLKNTVIISGSQVSIHPVTAVANPAVQFRDTLMFDNVGKKYIPYREISFYTKDKNDQLYHVHFYKSLIESDFLIEKVAMIVTLMVMIFLLAVYFLYRYFFRKIWADFFITVDKIGKFDISSPEKIDFPESMIIEFNRLNHVLNRMTERILNDFNGLKEFTANLSHEIQTPLAVIKSKNELILQNENTPEKLLQLAADIQSEANRLSRLIKALSLLAKIDNRQYTSEQKVSLREVVTQVLSEFQNIMELKGITLETNIVSEPELVINKELTEVLLLNLVKNAVRHNVPEGKIIVDLNDEYFLIKNTGPALSGSPEKLFTRFAKANPGSASLGIGLSIVRKICDLYGFPVTYVFADGLHQIKVNFSPYE